jgi:hypothetical protein
MSENMMQQTIAAVSEGNAPSRAKTRAYLMGVLCHALIGVTDEHHVDGVLAAFAARYEGVLLWLGEAEQNDMLHEVEEIFGLDLARWIDGSIFAR